MNHSAAEREALLELWETIADERPESTLFKQCAAQRLMQAMGAYANILNSRGNEWYRPHIYTAANLLADVIKDGPLEEPLTPILRALK
jgi:Mn-containing catalase